MTKQTKRLNKAIKSNNQQAQSRKEKTKNPSKQNDFCPAKFPIFYPVRNFEENSKIQRENVSNFGNLLKRCKN